jgi:hypothetical protein
MSIRSGLLGLSALTALASVAQSQQITPLPNNTPRFYAGGEPLFAKPRGEFQNYVNQGWGLGAHFITRIDEKGILGLRVDAGFVNYGNFSQRVPLSPTTGDLIKVDLKTSNNIFFAGVGPQLTIPAGFVRPYVNGNVGFSYFSTSSTVEGTSNDVPFASTENQHDATFSYGGGAGIYIPMPSKRVPVSLDIGARYARNPDARYLTRDRVRDHVQNKVPLTPISSQVDLWTYHVGVSVGIPNAIRPR